MRHSKLQTTGLVCSRPYHLGLSVYTAMFTRIKLVNNAFPVTDVRRLACLFRMTRQCIDRPLISLNDKSVDEG